MPKSSLMGLRWVLAPAAAFVAAADLLRACRGRRRRQEGRNRGLSGHGSARLPGCADPQRSSAGRRAILRRLGPQRRGRPSHAHRHRSALRLRQLRDRPGSADRSRPASTVLAGTNVADQPAPATCARSSAVSIDPAYDPATLSHDAAVLTLTAPIDGTGGHAIDFIADDPWVPPPGATAAVVSGWGRIDASTYPNDLRWAEMPFATDSSCQSSWADDRRRHVDSWCAPAVPEIDSCFGDSGGPLVTSVEVGLGVFDTELAGIVSYGDLDCDGSPPGVYTRVASPAIQDYISQDDPGQRAAQREPRPPWAARPKSGRRSPAAGAAGTTARRSTTSSCAASTVARRLR